MSESIVAHWPGRIVFGPGSVSSLETLSKDLGIRRAMVICGSTVAGGEMLERVRAGLGDVYGGLFDGVMAQNPVSCIRAGAEMARDLRVDGVVSIGGGSAIDAAKCIIMFLASDGDLDAYRIDHEFAGQARQLSGSLLAHVAIPTTTGSSSEAMPTAGCLDTERHRKMLFWDQALVPGLVVLDPEMATFCSSALTGRSGMTSVARCVEALYSRHRQPISTGLATHALRLLRRSLPRTVTHPQDVAARGECQLACLMSGVAAINAMVSVVHALGHVFGGRFGLQHGVGHAILLAPTMRLMLPAIGDDAEQVAEALGVSTRNLSRDDAVLQAAASIETLIGQLELACRLRDVGIREDDLGGIAAAAMDDYMMASAPRALDQDDIVNLLKSAL